MTQTDRDRLVALKEAKDKKITQRQAAEDLQMSERKVRRLPTKLRMIGDKAVIHGMRNRGSNRNLCGRTATMTMNCGMRHSQLEP